MAAESARVPFSQFVVKLTSRCDLACDHCYVFEHADQSWRGRPIAMSEQTAAQIAHRIAEHATRHRLRRVTVVLHGGEPLLYGAQRTRHLLALLRDRMPAQTRLDLSIHTNAVRLDTTFLDLFLEFGVRVGVSLDGDRTANDLHRVFANGRTSHPQVLRALSLLREPQYRHLYAGILVTVDVRNDPIRVYEGVAAEQPPRIDLLLPHATWDNPPLTISADAGVRDYAAWLTAVYDRWTADGCPFGIRTFDSIADLLHGLPSGTEALGLAARDLVVVESDGTIEQADSLKTAFEGAAGTGLNVFEHSFDQAASHTGIAARQGGTQALSAECRACRVVEVCGGGMYAHRYKSDTGFDNPSIYCESLKTLITHISLGERRREAESGVSPHSLSPADFAALASGFGDAATIRRLAEPQISINRTLVRQIGTSLAPDSPSSHAWNAIIRLDQEHRAVLESVLADPYNRVWSVQVLTTGNGCQPPVTAARLTGIAASAALLADTVVQLPLQVANGVVHLPTLGTLAVGGADRPASIATRTHGVAVVTVDGTDHEVGLPTAERPLSPLWRPLRRLSADEWSVALDDIDPFRDCHQWAPAERLSDDDADLWQQRFTEAVEYLERRLPHYLPGLRAGLSTLMPMAAPAPGRDVSGTARQAYGAVGLALPADGPTLALLMIHEFQHVKLGAVLDLYDFYDQADDRLYYAPWRDDPRPLEGLYQGAYAHLAVTDYWRARREDMAGEQRDAAEASFARWRLHTADAVDVLLDSGSLTRIGKRFAHGMAETVASWLDEPVTPAASASAQRAAAAHRAAWERHLQCAEDSGR